MKVSWRTQGDRLLATRDRMNDESYTHMAQLCNGKPATSVAAGRFGCRSLPAPPSCKELKGFSWTDMTLAGGVPSWQLDLNSGAWFVSTGQRFQSLSNNSARIFLGLTSNYAGWGAANRRVLLRRLLGHWPFLERGPGCNTVDSTPVEMWSALILAIS